MLPDRKWLWVRVSFVGIGAVTGPGILAPDVVETSNVDWWACLTIILGVPPALCFVIGVQAFNPLSDPTWRRPSWMANPFAASQPLQFCHAASFFFLAGGLSACAALPFYGWASAPLAVSPISLGVGLWMGVWICVWLFRKKMERVVT